MWSKQFAGIATLMLAGLTGCAMCDNAQDYSYGTYGGRWQRGDPVRGRVASVFDPAGVQISDAYAPTVADGPIEFYEGDDSEEAFEASPDDALNDVDDTATDAAASGAARGAAGQAEQEAPAAGAKAAVPLPALAEPASEPGAARSSPAEIFDFPAMPRELVPGPSSPDDAPRLPPLEPEAR